MPNVCTRRSNNPWKKSLDLHYSDSSYQLSLIYITKIAISTFAEPYDNRDWLIATTAAWSLELLVFVSQYK